MPLRPRQENPHRVVRVLLAFTHPRAVLLTNPTVIIAVGLFFLAVTFTIWPRVLEHAPISFEKLGVIHHIWHYSLLGGSVLTIYGAFSASIYRLQYELIGWLILLNALVMNLVAQLDLFFNAGPLAVHEGVTGLGLGIRGILIALVLLRMFVLYFEPKVSSTITNIVVEQEEDEDE